MSGNPWQSNCLKRYHVKSHYWGEEGVLMNLMMNVVRGNCLACGAAQAAGDLEFGRNGSIGRCSRCAMVAELISELIQKQVRDDSRLYREVDNAQAR